MSKRLTQARCVRWEDQLDKAMSIVAKVEEEQRSYYASAKGGRYHDLMRALGATKSATLAVKHALTTTHDLTLGEIRRGA